MQSSSRDRMHRKATDDELVLCRDIPRRLARRSPCCIAGNTCRFRNYRCKPTCHGEAEATGRLNTRAKSVFALESRLLPSRREHGRVSQPPAPKKKADDQITLGVCATNSQLRPDSLRIVAGARKIMRGPSL